MADPVEKSVEAAPAVTAAESVAPSQVSDQGAAAPAAEPAAASPATATETPAAVEPAAASEPTLLEQFDAEKAQKEQEAKAKEPEKKPEAPKDGKPEDKPAPEAKPEEKTEAKPNEPGKTAEPATLEPVAYEYTLPETLKLDDATKGELHTALDAFRADPAKGVQGLIDLHNKTMTQYAADLKKETLDNQMRAFNETRKEWRTKVMSSEDLGGAGYQTAMGAVARMRDMFVPEAERAEFESFLKYTGAGDHPAFLRMLHTAARYFDEPGVPPPNPQPTKDAGRPPNRRATLYDNPRSPNNRQ